MTVKPIRPDFERPPLAEQAISIVFEPIQGFRIVDYGLFWSEIAADFPNVATEAPLEAPIEEFESVRPSQVSFKLHLAPPIPRAMFRNQTNGELVQLQNDRFGLNWAKIADQEYPRSEPLMARFRILYEKFSQYVERQSLGPLVLRQCELTNLNVIPVSDFGNSYSDFSKAFRVDAVDFDLPYLQPEMFERSRQLRINDSKGNPLGRLHMTIAPVISNVDNTQAFRFELTARSAPKIQSLEDALGFFDVARNAINGAFIASVTDEIKSKWGEKHGE